MVRRRLFPKNCLSKLFSKRKGVGAISSEEPRLTLLKICRPSWPPDTYILPSKTVTPAALRFELIGVTTVHLQERGKAEGEPWDSVFLSSQDSLGLCLFCLTLDHLSTFYCLSHHLTDSGCHLSAWASCLAKGTISYLVAVRINWVFLWLLLHQSQHFCGHYILTGLSPSHCLSPCHHCCSSSGLLLDHCNSPLIVAWLSDHSHPKSAQHILQWLLFPQRQTLNSVIWFFTTWSSPTFQLASPPAKRHPRLLLDHWALSYLQTFFPAVSSWLWWVSPWRQLCNYPKTMGRMKDPHPQLCLRMPDAGPREDDHHVPWPKHTGYYLPTHCLLSDT